MRTINIKPQALPIKSGFIINKRTKKILDKIKGGHMS